MPAGRAHQPLRILVVHNRYQVEGGEDVAVAREIASLRRAGQSVETLILDNDVIRTPFDQLKTAFQAPHAPSGIDAVVGMTKRFRPDIVHVHNTFPLISPGVYAPVRQLGAATVQTLHNFRLVCANGLLLRDGVPCERCVKGSPFQAVSHGCYRGSRLGSLAVARMIDVHRRRGTWTHDVDRFIALTDFARDRFLAAGLPAARLVVKPNGVADLGPPASMKRRGILYVGRLSEEKGIRVLAAAAAAHTRAPVQVIGDGPLAAELQGIPNLEILGRLPPAAVRRAMLQAAAIVVPSICYEGLPTVIAEAFAAGTPVVASRIGALPALVVEGETGLLADPGDPASLARMLDRIADDPAAAARMGSAGRAVFERRWTEEIVTARALDIYRDAITERAADHSHTTP